MRFFIALEIPEADREPLKKVQNQLSKLLPNLRLTDNSKLHLTLAFIGEQPDSLKDALITLLTEAVSGIDPFEITPSFLDGFPNIHHPSTIWVGVKGDVDKLQIIRERLKDSLKKINILIDERRFTPHIAIAKGKTLAVSPELESKLQTLIPPLSPIQINSIKLFESTPNQGFHIHNTLAEVKLI